MTWLTIVLIVLGVLLLGLVAVLGYLRWLTRPVEPGERSEPATALTEASSPARPMDEENPPRILIYKPRPGRALRPCSCHDRPIEPGTSVLFWPNPDGTVALFCPEGVREQQ